MAELLIDRDAALIGESAWATFSPCRDYRYALFRRWSELAEGVMWIMCNPSTADAFKLDPTVRKCIRFAQSWNHASVLVVNIFGLRSTDPKLLYQHPDPVGVDNDSVIGTWLDCWSGPVVAAWGVHGAYRRRGEQVAGLVRSRGKRLHCLGVTKGGHPETPAVRPGGNGAGRVPGRWPVSFKTLTCVALNCDGGCDDPWEADEGTPHFGSEAEAAEYAIGCGWLITAARALCARCSAKATCEATGHQWDDWSDASQAGIQARRRMCDRCSKMEYDPPFDELYPKFQALRDAEEILKEAGRAGDAR